MEMLGVDLPLWLEIILAILLLIVSYIVFFNWHRGEIEKLGLDGPKPRSIFLNLAGEGAMASQVRLYKEYKDKKVFGMYSVRDPMIMVTDPDIIRDIMVKHFNCFTNRRVFGQVGGAFDLTMTKLLDDQWKHVRNTVSPTFSLSKLRLMSKHLEATTKVLVENLTEKIERNEEVELKDTLSSFSIDAIASAGFGVNINSMKDPNNPFAQAATKTFKGIINSIIVCIFFPFLLPLWRVLGLSLGYSEPIKVLISFVDKAMASRREEGSKKRNDFLQLLLNAEEEEEDNGEHDGQTHEEREALKTDQHRKGLTKLEIQGQALVFLLAGHETTSTVLSFTMFLLAMNKEALKKVQEELDEKLGGSFPSYDNVQELTYLDMCVSEGIRMYPPGSQLDRRCGQEVEIQGVRFPKGILVGFPCYALHHDPDLWSEPETFDPERFSPENKANIHPYSYLAFGHGPRNCIGMRLALLEVKIALAAVLQVMTPVACKKTVYPIKLHKIRMMAEDGLWVKFERRKTLSIQ